MTYNEKGLGIAEMTYVSLNYPEVFATMELAFDDDQDQIALDIARKMIKLEKQLNGGK